LRGACRLTYAVSRMKDLLLALLHLVVMTAKLCGPGGARAVIAENLLLKQQLIVLRRARHRAPNLTLQAYYNVARSHASLGGHTPLTFAGGHPVARTELNNVRWVSHRRDLVQLPEAA
jgi:hypothetical protein